MRLSGPALQVRYQEARRYWMFLIAPELHQKEEEFLSAISTKRFQRGVQQALRGES